MDKHFTDRQIEIIQAATHRIDAFGMQELTIKNLAADIDLSEAALYRHFKSKNDIMLGLLTYFNSEMQTRLSAIVAQESKSPTTVLKEVFNSQLNHFTTTPAVVCVIFSEGIFQFNKDLSNEIFAMMKLMQHSITSILVRGQEEGLFIKSLSAEELATIIMGSIRMVVLKWKITGHQTDLLKDGQSILNGLLKMIETPA